MENLALVGLVENLKAAMAEVVIRRVIQQQPHGFTFQTRSVRLPALKVVLDPRHPALYASESKPPLEAAASDFLMVLRKHLTSAEVVSFSKPLSERVLEFVFKTVVPSKELETMSLVVELLPNAPNLILLDAERRVLTSFCPVSPQHGMAEYESYTFPSSGDKIDLERIMNGEIVDLEGFATATQPQSWLIRHIAGLGPVFAGEIAHRQKKSGRPVAEEIRDLVEQIRKPAGFGWLYTEVPLGHILDSNDLVHLGKAILSPVELESIERTHSAKVFSSLLEAAKFIFDELESRALLEKAKAPILRDLRDSAKKFTEREKRLVREQKNFEDAEELRKTAQMLTSSGMKMEDHYETVTATDYYSEKPQQIQIPLDSKLSLRENIDKMFKRHAKAGRGKHVVATQLVEIRRKIGRLDDQMRRLHAIKDWDTWLAISDKLDRERRRGHAPESPVREPAQRHLRSVEIEGREILIGRNGSENDEVTFHLANPDDFWLHVADYSGSHVVVRNPTRDKELSGSLLTKAAQLAAFFSQARNSSKVEVHHTKRKHISKPKRSRPGAVKLLEFKSISVEPKNWLEV